MLIFALLLAALPARALTLSEFQEKMKKHVAALSAKSTASVRIQALGKDEPLFTHNDELPLVPASGAKLFTAIVALEQYGARSPFLTEVKRQGDVLTIEGGGDPYLVSERLWLLARDVARSGVKNVSEIRVSNALGETYRGLTEFQGSGEPFTALVSPAALNFNSVEIHVIPEKGKRPRVEAGPLPNDYAELRNEVESKGGSGRNLTVKPLGAKDGKEVFVVSGSIGRNAEPATVYGTVSDPESHLAAAFAAMLRREGVKVASRYGLSATGAITGESLASLDSLPMPVLTRLFATYSNNFMAEAVFMKLGQAPASQEHGLAKMKEFLARHPACKDSAMTNGSGLSWDTKISARCFTETLAFAYRDFGVFADLLGSLPVGGQTGTLEHRFDGTSDGFKPTKVRAKTGTLWSKMLASSLTGVAEAGSGEKLLFSLIVNDPRGDRMREVKEWETKCVELMQELRL